MRAVLVIARYGGEIVGGAESHVREFAQRLAEAGHQVSVLTTCVRDHFSWENAYPPGVTVERGVRVERFLVSPRDHAIMRRLQPAIDAGLTLPDHLQREWVRNGGYTQALLARIDEIADSVDVFLFTQYLYGPTVFGALLHPGRSLVMPLLHDEPTARFACVGEVLSSVAGLVFNTAAERDLAARLWGPLPPNRVVGAGFDIPPPPNVAAFRRRHRLQGELVAYAGRREMAKNFPLVAESVTAYNLALSADGRVTLLALGGGNIDLPRRAREHVVDLGFLSQEEKLAALASSLVVANLSRFESLSFVIMEAWSVGVPVIVHADCAVTRRACEESGGGLWIRSVEEFAGALDRLRADRDLRDRMGQAGRRFVAERYSWSAVIKRLEEALRDLPATA